MEGTEVDEDIGAAKWKVFTNDVIWKHLGHRLNHLDLKESRLVCQQFNQSVLNSTNLKHRSDLHLRGALIDNVHAWRHLSLDLSNNDNNNESIKSASLTFQDLESLTLTRTSSVCSSQIQVLHQLLSHSLKLTRLTIDGQILVQLAQQDLVKLFSKLTSLNELEILCKTHLDSREHRQVMVNLHEIIKSARNLHVLRIPTSLVGENRFGPINADIISAQYLIAAVELSENWTDLSLSALFWRAMSLKPPMKFKNLKSLKLTASKFDTEFVTRFLRLQDKLENLDMVISGRLTSDMMDVVKLMNLKTLKIKCQSINWDEKTWSFLKNSRLTEFAFHLHKGSVALPNKLVEMFFENLPSSLVKFKCRGIKRERRMRLDCCAMDLKRFDSKLLTHLDLSRCIGLVMDSTVEFICRNFKLLQYLDLSNARASDYGFTGKHKNGDDNGDGDGVPAEFSIQDLKGLKVLVLQKCWRIGDATLVEAIKFLELTELDLRGNEQFSEWAITKMATKNPSLRTLRTSCMSKKLDHDEIISRRRKFAHEIRPSDDSDEEEPRSSSNDFKIHSNVSIDDLDEII